MNKKTNKMTGTEIINKTARPNSLSFRWGGSGTDVKLYFEDANDLENQLTNLNSKMTNIKNKMDSFIGTMSK